MLLLLLALIVAPQTADLTDALALGRTHDQALYDSFTAGYRLPASGIVERVEVITEFRRAVLLVRERAAGGVYSFTARDLADALAPYRGTVALEAVVRLNPLNTFATPPAYDLYITTGAGSRPIAAATMDRSGVYPPGFSPPGTAMTGVRLDATFVQADLAVAAGATVVIADQNGQIVWQARLDFSRFR